MKLCRSDARLSMLCQLISHALMTAALMLPVALMRIIINPAYLRCSTYSSKDMTSREMRSHCVLLEPTMQDAWPLKIL